MRRRDFLGSGIAMGAALAWGRFARPVEAATSKNGRLTIKCVSTWGSVGDFDRELAAEFMKANPDINVEFAALGEQFDRQKVQAYQAGDPYDLWVTGSFYSMWATQMGYTIDPAPLFRRDFGPDYQSLFVNELVWWQGKMVGVLTGRAARVFYYNKSIIEAAGLPLPHEEWTWDDFVRIATGTVKRDPQGNIVQWGCRVYESDLFRFYISLEGQSMFSPDYRKATIDTPVGRAALRAINELVFTHHAMGDVAHWRVDGDVVTSWNPGAFFKEGKVALLLAASGGFRSRFEQAARAGFRVGVAPLPQRKTKVAGLENGIFQIWPSRDPARTEAAWKFAKFYLTRENQVRAMVETGSSPVRLDAYDDPRAKDYLRQWPDEAVANRAYKHGRFDARIAQYPTMALEYLGIRPFVYRMMQQKLTPAEAVKQMQAKCQTILDDFWSKADKGVFELFPEALHK